MSSPALALLVALGLSGPAAPVPVTDLAPWEARLGVALAVPAGCRAAALGEDLLLDCAGVGLIFAPVASPTALINSQSSPFADAGVVVPSPTARACTVQGAPAACLGTEVRIPPGAPMTLLAGKRLDAGWSVLCLHRQAVLPALCAAWFGDGG